MKQSTTNYRKRRYITEKTKAIVYNRDGLNCKICGVHVWRCPYEEGCQTIEEANALPFKRRAVLDHILPVFHGGSNDADNLQILCLSCNSKKGHKLMEVCA
jgi:5-methylcytosine-specific restriction endonuclease McrA